MFAALKHTSIRARLLTAIALLVGGLLYFAIGQVVERIHTARMLATIETLSTVAVRSSALVHELQKERGLSSGKFLDTMQGIAWWVRCDATTS